MAQEGQVAPVGQIIRAAQEAQEGPNTPAGRVDQAGPVDRTVPAAQEATMGPAGPAARAAPVDPVDPVDPDGRVTEARVDRTTMAGIGARHPRTCPGAAWTRAGSTTSRSITTAAG
ncbi:hypothetical protein HGA11_01935 [Mycolicibacterium septicum DSM 44393]|uniref:Uncharacterized protein n=1 Tax=Mycolicibacterium septicum DSM 44393 TaxID=1341646 RepID=A0A7X6MKN6_9MYCO|nr:hypothetical protein [Mycolicibacterium septicum DSM 44393]